VYVPTRSPVATSSDVIMRAVDVLPLVPVRWIASKARCGSPIEWTSARMRRMPGTMTSGRRLKSAVIASAYKAVAVSTVVTVVCPLPTVLRRDVGVGA
jgi:hypothetical protein